MLPEDSGRTGRQSTLRLPKAKLSGKWFQCAPFCGAQGSSRTPGLRKCRELCTETDRTVSPLSQGEASGLLAGCSRLHGLQIEPSHRRGDDEPKRPGQRQHKPGKRVDRGCQGHRRGLGPGSIEHLLIPNSHLFVRRHPSHTHTSPTRVRGLKPLCVAFRGSLARLPQL